MAILTNSSDLVRASQMSWHQHMKLAIRCPQQLAERLEVPIEAICPVQSVAPFPLFVPLPFLSRIRKGDLRDPLLLQVLPASEENQVVEGFGADPLAESEFGLTGGLLKKYEGRALLVCNGTCAVHCRYCFRRHFPYEATVGVSEQWQPALDQIAQDESIEEVILSGGDPLTLVDSVVSKLVAAIESIPHVTRLRFHTRLPIVIPQRVTDELIECLTGSRLATVFVIHANHANELDDSVAHAVSQLTTNRIAVLNQSVLLRGVNDSFDALSKLSKRLVEIGAVPYYLHQLDPVAGAAHFHVPIDEGKQLIADMRSKLSGYLVPRYVQEQPGKESKTILE